jgi:hypothetical protein
MSTWMIFRRRDDCSIVHRLSSSGSSVGSDLVVGMRCQPGGMVAVSARAKKENQYCGGTGRR